MERFIHDETNGLDYELVGDYYLPCLKVPKSPKVGRFGIMYLDYLRNHNKVTYSGLMLSGKLKEHIEDIDRQAEETFSQLVEQMKQAEGMTEELKRREQMKWGAGLRWRPLPEAEAPTEAATETGLMNNIRNRAEEIVLQEVIFV